MIWLYQMLDGFSEEINFDFHKKQDRSIHKIYMDESANITLYFVSFSMLEVPVPSPSPK